MMRSLTLATVTALALSASAPALASASQPPVAAAVEPTAPAAQPAAPQADATDAARYAHRDATQRADSFTGGSLIVIGVSGTVLIVALIVVLVLL
jgi:hypothetical protein